MRTFRLDEFVAHSGAVNCVRIGRSTAGVLATGGDDKRVNLWRTGQHDVVKSLCGLQSCVECVVFDEKEDTIAAGGANGTVKVWDMESGKVSRSLTGHRSNCLSLAFTVNDTNQLVSGSLDCNVKVWDLRRKEAIITFKGHKKGVMKVAPSPDNKWVCSGSEDGELKVWELTSGKMVQDGWKHNGRITGIEFNPNELLMVSSGSDKIVRVWDMEEFQEVEYLGPEATAVQGIAYAADGSMLLTATADALKVWGLEPKVHHDTVPIDWRNLADLHSYYKNGEPYALGCCRNGSSVGVFMVDLRKVAPYCSSEDQDAAPAGIGAGGSQQRQLQNSFSPPSAPVVQQYPGTPQPQQQSSRSGVGVDRDAADGSPVLLALLCEAAQAPAAHAAEPGPLTRQLPRQRTPPRATPPRGLASSSSSTNSRQAGSAAVQPARQTLQVQPYLADRSPQQQSHDYFPEVEVRVPLGRPPASEPSLPSMQPASRSQSRPSSAAVNVRAQPGATSSRPNSGYADISQLAAGLAAASLQEPQRQQQQASRSNSSRPQEPPGAMSATLAAWLDELPASAPDASAAHSKSSSRSTSMPASRMPSRQNMSELQPQRPAAAAAPAASIDPILAAMAARPMLKVELSHMASALQVAKGFAGRGNLEGAYKSVLSQGDPALACMVLEALNGRADAFELNTLEPLIKLLDLVLGSGQEQQVAVGLSVLSLVLRGPGQTVHDVCTAPQPTGVDLSFEARRSKCTLLKMALEGLGLKIGVLSRSHGPVSTRAQLLAEELKRIVTAA